MDKPDINALAQKMIEAVKGFVARSELAIGHRLDELEGKVKAIPEPLKGDPGKDADPKEVATMVVCGLATGDSFSPTMIEALHKNIAARVPPPSNGKNGLNAYEVAVSLGFEGTVHDWMKSLDGKPGDPGKSVTPDEVLPALKADLQKAVESIPVPKDGEDGKDGKSVTADDVLPALNAELQKAIDQIHSDVLPPLRSEVQKAIGAIPTPKDGKDADPEEVRKLVATEVAKAVAAIPPAPKGDPGDDGESVTAEQILPSLKAELQKAVEAIPIPQDGKNADPEAVRSLVAAEVAKAVSALPPAPKGDRGDSIHPDTIALMVSEAVQKAVAALPKPKDGDPGRDAVQIMVLPGIDESRSYPAGTYAKHNGGEIRAERRTDPVKDGDIFSAGWTVARDGVSAVVVTQGDDPRAFEIAAMLTSGTKTIAKARIPVPMDCGVYRAGQAYEKGDIVSYGGSSWIAQRDTQSKPETDDSWRLMVKRGRDGKDANKVERTDSAPVRFR